MSPPALIRRVGPEHEVWKYRQQTDPFLKAILLGPPKEILSALRSPRHQSILGLKVPSPVQGKLNGPHPKTTPWNQLNKRGEMPEQTPPRCGWLPLAGEKFFYE